MSKDSQLPVKPEFLLYKAENGKIVVEVQLQRETVWITQAQLAALFKTDRSVITRHIGNVFKSRELSEKSNVQKMHIASSDKPVKYYSLWTIAQKTNYFTDNGNIPAEQKMGNVRTQEGR